jgi:hopene-associated glycosyltransferase HpnB
MVALIPEVAGGIAVTAWVYLLLARGAFWRAVTPSVNARRPMPGVPSRWNTRPVAAVIPARNEVEVVAQSITSLLAQSEAENIHIFLVDDESSDGTAEAALAAARNAGKPAALTVIRGQAPPPGWTGKLWALQQGVMLAREFGPRCFLFTDADVAHTPEDFSRVLEAAAGGGYDMASLMVRLHCESWPEKLLIPAFLFFFFQLYPPKWTGDSRRKTAGAAGGCILIRPEALERAGGIAAIRHEVIDDCALARAVKRSGGKVWLGTAETAASVRPHRSLAEIGRMISRTAFSQLKHSAVLLLLTILGMMAVYLLPVALVFSLRPPAAILGLAAWLLMAAAYFPAVRYYRLCPLWALSLPVAALFYTGATLVSALNYWAGRGGQWKGRIQDPGRLQRSFK